MELKWTSKALFDLERLYEFLAPVNPAAAARTIQALTKAPRVPVHGLTSSRLPGGDFRSSSSAAACSTINLRSAAAFIAENRLVFPVSNSA